MMEQSRIILVLAAGLSLGFGCAKTDWIDRTLVTVDVTGSWRSAEGSLLELVLTQQGSKVTGSIAKQGTRNFGNRISGAIEGTVAGAMATGNPAIRDAANQTFTRRYPERVKAERQRARKPLRLQFGAGGLEIGWRTPGG